MDASWLSKWRQLDIPSSFGSRTFPSCFTRWIRFRFASGIWTRTRKSSLSAGQESCLGTARLRIIVHLPEAQASLPETREIGAAITGYFGYRARIIGLDLNELFRVGRWALAIGVAVLSFSVIIGQTVVIRLAPQPLAGLIAESLLIFGWVANWRPIEIFLYEWWPLVRRRNLYRRLAAAQVELKPYKTDRGPPAAR